MKRYIFFGLVGSILVSAGCTAPPSPTPIGSGPVRVVVTTSIIADAVKIVGGPHVQVSALMGAGIDPHTYLPTPGDSEALSTAHIVFFNGLHLEGKMTTLLEENRAGMAKAVAVASRIPNDRLRAAEGAEGAHDPHVWFDVKLWMSAVEVIRDELATLDPSHADDYRANAERYLAEMAKLDAEVRAKANSLPAHKRVLVTSHDAFGYFAAAYGFEVRGLQGVSTASAPSTRDVDELANFLGQRQVPAVFCETSVLPKGLEKVLDTVRAKYNRTVRLVGDGDALYSDALGEPGTPGATYIGMVRHNIDVLVKNLQ